MKFYTVGYGGRSPSGFLELLQQHGIRTIVDVRIHPDRASMGSYVKARSASRGIEALLQRAGIGYRSLTKLGNPFIGQDDWRERYRDLIERDGEQLTEPLASVPGPWCLMCAEKRVAGCHRSQIADFLVEHGWEVEHIE